LLKRAHDEGRKDDTPDVIARRLEIYHRETEPLVEHYRAHGILVGVQADATVNEVFNQIQQALEQVAVR
jgi:adenylate kinase